MSVRRKSTVLAKGRPSTASIYSATLDINDDDEIHDLSRYCPLIYVHKADVYHMLERQEGKHTLAYHLFVFLLTLISLIFGSISTIDEWRDFLNKPLYYGELILSIFFTYELFLRIWSAGCLAKYRTWFGRLMFILRLAIILDVMTLFGFALCLLTGITTGEFPNYILQILPLLQMIRFIRVDRQLSSWKILKDIILTHRQELTVTVVIGFMFLLIGACFVHIAETPINPKLNIGSYKSMADSIWFSIITMTTIGFGDLSPTTFQGKIVTTTICYLGVAFWCLPSGIIGSGLAIKVQEQKRDEAVNRLVPAAASVIRNWWRLRCTYKGDKFVATWQIYRLAQRRVHKFTPTINEESNVIIPPNKSFLIRSISNTAQNEIKASTLLSIPKRSTIRRKSIQSIDDLPKRYVTAIKIIRLLKYSSSCKKFQQAKKPIDLKDVVTENTQMNNRLSSMLNDIQRRLDVSFGTTKFASYLPDEQKRQASLTGRIENLEKLANQVEDKLYFLEKLAADLKKS